MNRYESALHIRIKLILLARCPVFLTLQSTIALQPACQLLLMNTFIPQGTHKPGLLHLLFKARLQSVIGFFPLSDSVHSHKAEVA